MAYYWIALAAGLLCLAAAQLVSHSTGRIAALVLAFVAFAVAVGVSVDAVA